MSRRTERFVEGAVGLPITSQTQLSILQALQARGGAMTQREMLDAFRDEAVQQGAAVSTWLHPRLHRLEATGYIESEQDDKDRPVRWMLREAGRLAVAPADTGEPLAEGSDAPLPIVQPRRPDMFRDYEPPRAAPHRPGALDYARAPSLINGTRRDWRPGH